MSQYPALDAAIAQVEGFGQPGVPATVNNNPGNLVAGSFASSQGAIGKDSNGFAIFPNPETGFQALDSNVNYYAQHGFSIQDMLAKWAPASDPRNNPQAYANSVQQITGLDPNAPVANAAQTGSAPAPKTGNPWDSAAAALSGSLPGVSDVFSSVLGGMVPGGSMLASGKNPDGTPSAFSWARVASFLVGLIALGAGIIMLKGGDVIQVAQSSARNATIAA